MARIIVLDAGPVGMACHESRNDEASDFRTWAWAEAARGSMIIVPEIADYEVRRSLLVHRSQASLARLDDLRIYPAIYLPLTTPAFRRAAELWAQARRRGDWTAGDQAIDGDAILAAQALEYCSDADDWWVATENARHLARHVGGMPGPGGPSRRPGRDRPEGCKPRFAFLANYAAFPVFLSL